MTGEAPAVGQVRGAIMFVVGFALMVISQRMITPHVAAWLEPSFGPADGSGLFLRHLLTFSLVTAAISLAAWFAFARAGWLAPVRPWLGFGPGAIRLGVIAGVALSAFVLIVGIAMGERVHFHPDAWKMFGNVFSNYYEELTYRGLLMQAAWAATGSRVAAVVLSSLVFGWTHMHGSHAMVMAIGATIAGCVFGALAIRTRSLGGAWVAHQVSDMILDSL
jgi:membrane protease YdiL (CAAX protease family)